MKRHLPLLMTVVLLALSGCSTVVHEQSQNVSISSNPPGATVVIDNRRFLTPATVPLKGKPEYYFTVEKPGYKTASGKVDSEFRVFSSVVGNIFNLTGIVGFAVDYWGTGTAFELQKNNTITLEPLAVAPAAIDPQFQYAPAAAPSAPAVGQ